MRKVSIAALALAVVLAVAGVAIAANTYEVHQAGTTVGGKGSKDNPIPTGIKLGFKVGETDSSKRATVIEKYSLGAEGLVTNPKLFPKCKFGDVDDAKVPKKCKKALVGSGLVKNAAGPSTDPSLASSSPCNLQLRLYNTGKGMAIRLDSNGQPAPGPFGDFSSNKVGCLLPIATAINARFVKTRIGGQPASDLRFTVPQNLKHPLTGTDNSIRETTNTVKLLVKRVRENGRMEKRGFYQKVGCKGNKRTTRATFTTEATASQAPETFTATTTRKC